MRLSSYRGKMNVLLVFLPAAFTPICSTELPALAALTSRFLDEASTVPFPVTVDNAATNQQWLLKCGAEDVRLLSDFWPHGAVSAKYGLLADDGVSERSTIIVDKNGRVAYAASAGRFGARSIPDLLAIATQLNAGRPLAQPTAPVLRPLTVPTLFVTSTCPHCRVVLNRIAQLGLGDRVVTRFVDGPSNRAAMLELIARRPDAAVPLLATLDGKTHVGEPEVLASLQAMVAK